jgi:hypothetical protein
MSLLPEAAARGLGGIDVADPVQGDLEVQTSQGATRILLDPDLGDVTAGGQGGIGDLVLKDESDRERIRLGRVTETLAFSANPKGGFDGGAMPVVTADYMGLRVRTADLKNVVQLGFRAWSQLASAQAASTNPILFTLGGGTTTGSVQLRDGNDKPRVILGEHMGKDARLLILGPDGRVILEFDPSYAALYVGGKGNEGDLVLRDNEGLESAKLDGGDRSLRLGTPEAPRIRLEGGNAWLGGNGEDGDLVLFTPEGDNKSTGQASIHLDGAKAHARLGGSGQDGAVTLKAADGSTRLRLDGGGGNLWLGGNGQDGDVVIFSKDGDNSTVENASIHLNGDAGDIILRNADCAEEFDVPGPVEAGTVMVLDGTGRLEPSRHPYDRRVAGVVSGAGPYRPGIVLDRKPRAAGPRAPIALVGKVACKVDAGYGAVQVGDLLTTSPTPGHAMRVEDPGRAFGAVLGKALAPLARGVGHVPILVTLQ